MRIAPPAVNHRSVAASSISCVFVATTSCTTKIKYTTNLQLIEKLYNKSATNAQQVDTVYN